MVRIELKSEADASGVAARVAASARKARALAPQLRAKLCSAVADGLEKDAEAFARLIVEEVRKPIKAARGEVSRAVNTFRLAAVEAARAGGETLKLDDRDAIVERVPRGPALFITPFNFPLNLVAHKVAPAVAAGLPFALKPDPRCPKSAEKLIVLLTAAGWPADAALVVDGPIPLIEVLVRDERFKILSFTGSTKVGWHLKSIAGKKHCLLELGGNAGVFVAADAALPWPAARCAWGAYVYSGQTCISVQRIFVEKPAHEEFRRLLVQNIKELKTGQPADEGTDVGPLIDEANAVRVETWVKEAVAKGAKLWAGGPRQGSTVPATLLEGAPDDCKVSCEEVFGPVATLEAVDSRQKALDRLNASRYGLQAGVFTNDLAFARRAFDELEVGGVIVNDVPTYRSDAMPYGGVKDSGTGREGVRWAIEDYTEPKTMVLKI